MKNKKTKFYEEYDDEGFSAKREDRHRRPIRNWTKAYVEHESDYDEYDDFHNYRIKS